MRRVLLPLSWLYGGAVAARNALYDAGALRVERAPVPVVAIGNLVAGGAGKTPCALYVIASLLRAGKRPALISRGYGRQRRGTIVVSDGERALVSVNDAGDEPLLVARRMPGAIVVVAEKRIDAARAAAGLGADCCVADDAFQHRALARDLDIVVIGEELSSGRNALLPAGWGREPLAALRRAQIVVATARDEESAARRLAALSRAQLFFADVEATDVIDVKANASVGLEALRDRAALVVTGIARPERVLASLAALGARVIETHAFRDHHRFTPDEVRMLAGRARNVGAAIVTTEKDAVRIWTGDNPNDLFDFVELFAVRVDLKLRRDDARFMQRILSTTTIES